MSLSLKHIPCPAGNRCTAFQCIFGHEKDTEEAIHTPANGGSGEESQDEDKASADQGLPRKRVKTATSNRNAPASKEAELPKASASLADKRPSGEESDKLQAKLKTLETATKPVSPPPLKRATTSSLKKHKESHAPSTSSSKNVPPTSKSNSTPASAKPKKVETLNPRLLKSSPASHEIRLKLLKMLFLEFMRLNKELKKQAKDDERNLLLSEQDLIIRALDEEEATAVQKAAIYSNVMKNKVMQYKRMNVTQWKTERSEQWSQAMKRKHGEEESPDLPKEIKTGLTPAQEVQLLNRLLTPIDKLSEHGYVSAALSEEDIEKARQGVEASKGWEKCDRCQQRFQVFPGRREDDGALTSGGSCTFHWGKTFIAPKTPGDRARQPKRYQCCGQEVGDSVGCFTRDHHVYKTTDPKRLANIFNFAKTPANPSVPLDRAVCFDCEMGYTVHGLELIRITATSWPSKEELLDVLVRPLGEVLDLNSRYSGVWPEDIAQAEPWTADGISKPSKSGDEYGSEDGEVKPTKKKLKIVPSPQAARDLLFSLISPETPLIGHGLENDLNSVRIIHPTLIDTVLLFPHKAGLPYRYGLKMLMDVHLNRKIQQETGPKMLGHDSAEDARAAGELVKLKIRNEWLDMQRAGWKFETGEFVPPKKTVAEGGSLTADFIEA